MLFAKETSTNKTLPKKLLVSSVSLCMAAILLTSCVFPAAVASTQRSTFSVLQPSEPGKDALDLDKVTVDDSNQKEGYFSVKSKLGEKKVKVVVDVTGIRYQYVIQNTDEYVTIPFSQGSNEYAISIWEHLESDSYLLLYEQVMTVELEDEFKPFLYPNQFVDFSSDDSAVELSKQLCEKAGNDIEVINAIYSWVIKNIAYDGDMDSKMASGYLPSNENTLDTRSGMCFDIAVLTCSMLRAEGIPTKLVIGEKDNVPHAWLLVYSKEPGKVAGHSLNAYQWKLMDPTHDATATTMDKLLGQNDSEKGYQAFFYH